MGPTESASATNFRIAAMRAEVMCSIEVASATNFRPTAVRVEVMGPTEIVGATNFRPTAVRTGVMGPAKLSLQRGAPTRKRERGEALGRSHIFSRTRQVAHREDESLVALDRPHIATAKV